MDEERQMVLRMLREGKVTVEEAEALLDALGAESRDDPEASHDDPGAEEPGGTEASGPAQGPPGEAPADRPWRFGPWPPIGLEIGEALREAARNARHQARASLRQALESLKWELSAAAGECHASGIVKNLLQLSSASEEVVLTHGISAGGRLVIRNPRGSVRVDRSGGGVVNVRAQKRAWARDEETARRLLERVRIEFAASGDDVTLNVAAENGEWGGRYRVDLTVEVPEGVAAALRVASGDVRVPDPSADLDVDVRSGDVQLGLVPGDLRLRLARGGVRAAGAVGRAQLEVMSGEVWLGPCQGETDASVRSGTLDLDLRGPRGVRAQVISGNLRARVESLAAGARAGFEVRSGNAALTLGPDVRASLCAEVRSGGIDCTAPLTDLRRSGHRLDARIGDAASDASVAVRVLSGHIAIREG